MKRLIVMLSVVAVCAGSLFAKGAVAEKHTAPAKATTNNVSSQADMGKNAIGFNFQINGGSSLLSYRHWNTAKTFIDGFEGMLGFNKNKFVTTTDLALQVMHSIKREQNLTVYSFGMLGIEPYSSDAQSGTNTYAAIGLGAEFFFQGLPNLSIGAEAGFGYSSPGSQYGNTAGWLPSLGIRYYY